MSGDDKVLIFCATKIGSENLNIFLNNDGFKCLVLHGDKNQKERDRAMDNFKQSWTRIMVATDVCARGLDIKDIRGPGESQLPHLTVTKVAKLTLNKFTVYIFL